MRTRRLSCAKIRTSAAASGPLPPMWSGCTWVLIRKRISPSETVRTAAISRSANGAKSESTSSTPSGPANTPTLPPPPGRVTMCTLPATGTAVSSTPANRPPGFCSPAAATATQPAAAIAAVQRRECLVIFSTPFESFSAAKRNQWGMVSDDAPVRGRRHRSGVGRLPSAPAVRGRASTSSDAVR